MKLLLRYPLTVSLLLSFVGIAFFLVDAAKMIPGGPFISFRGDILPHVFAALAILIVLPGYRAYSTGRRITALCVIGFALLLSTATALSTYAFFKAPYARGAFFRW